MPLSRYIKLDIEFLGLKAPRVRFLNTQNPNEVLDAECKTKLHSIIWWNLVWLAFQEFTKKHISVMFENFLVSRSGSIIVFTALYITVLM